MTPYHEFFAGGGFARVGLGPRLKCEFANELDTKKAISYRANHGSAELKVCDIAALTASDLPGHPSLLWGSPPCVGASLAGGRKGLGPEAWKFLDLVQALRDEGRAPALVAIENVPDMLTSDGGCDFDRTCFMLDEAGYRIGAMVIDAAMFTPQSRERLFVIAVATDIPTAVIADGPSEPFHPEGLVKALRRQRMQPIWFKLPVPPPHGMTLADIIDERSIDWNMPNETAAIIASMEPEHLARLASDKMAGKPVVRSLNRRTRRNGPTWESRKDVIANCLRTASGGSSIQTLMFINGETVRTRKISPTEYARAMGLPSTYRLPSNRTDAFNLIGDGLAVAVVSFIERHLISPILNSRPAVSGELALEGQRS